MPSSPKYTGVIVYLPPEDADWLRERAEAQDRTLSAEARRLIREAREAEAGASDAR